MTVLDTREVIGILTDNLERRGSVLPVPSRRATHWAHELGLARGGERVLYTGTMYHIVPYTERLVRLQQRLGGSRLTSLVPLARWLNRWVNGMALIARPSPGERAEYERVPANIAQLLQRAGVEFGYLYDDDLYTGVLAYDLGANEVVAAHARRIAHIFAHYGVREVITIDPHTTNMLRSVFPKLVEGFDVSVQSYLEVLAERGLPVAAPVSGDVVIHDSCVYARYEGVIEAPRQLLGAAGLAVHEPVNSRAMTWCCGGPAEALYPQKAAAVAAKRVEQLREAAPGTKAACVTMCPICLVNLKKAADGTMAVQDISEYLLQATQASH